MRRGWIGSIFFGMWALVLIVGLAAISIRHIAALPLPEDEVRLGRVLSSLRQSKSKGLIVHVISGECSCSRALFGHLIRRRAFADAEEIILWAGYGEDGRGDAGRSGFGFVRVAASELVSRFGIAAAPLMIAFDARGQLRYAGGYFDHPAALIPLDEKIHAALLGGSEPAALPVFGCAVAKELQKSLDPLGFSGFGRR